MIRPFCIMLLYQYLWHHGLLLHVMSQYLCGQVWSRPVGNEVLSHHSGWLQGALGMFNLNLPRSAWPKFVNIYRLLLHYLYICIKSLLHYLFLILYFCTLLSSIYMDLFYQLLPYLHLALLFQYNWFTILIFISSSTSLALQEQE